MKTIFTLIALQFVLLSYCQSDSLHILLKNEVVQEKIGRRQVTNELKDSCYSFWKITKIRWYKQPIIDFHRPDYPNGNYTKFVYQTFKTQNYYVVQYYNYGGHYIENRFLILDVNYRVLFNGLVEHGKKSPYEMLLMLKLGKYREIEAL